MPPLPSAEIPIAEQSRPKQKAMAGLVSKGRIYSGNPLPVGPSDYAPKNAKIIGRVIDISGVTYQLKIGEVEINDVSVEEILEYVSALELEEYEHQQFEEERIALAAVEAAVEEAKREKHERIKQRAKMKGVILYESGSGSNDESEAREQIAVGRHGRARPTYTHLFLKTKSKKGKPFVSNAHDSISMSDDNDETMSTGEPTIRAPIVSGAVSFTELSKRRRRERDKATGELLPLSPAEQETTIELQKRPRRRRHPVTGELMPIGWRYSAGDPDDADAQRTSTLPSPARNSNLSQDHQAKRRKLDKDTYTSRSPSPELLESATTVSPGTLRPFRPTASKTPKIVAVELLTSEDEADERKAASPNQVSRSPPKAVQHRSLSNMMHSATFSSTAETSPEPTLEAFVRKSPLKSPATQLKTSIMNPSAGHISSAEPPNITYEVEESDDNVGNDEWFIEAVLSHSWSDPRTHPTVLGDRPVMLYQVKWEGYKEPTWEPIESFTDRSVLNEYRRRVGLPAVPTQAEVGIGSDSHLANVAPRANAVDQTNNDGDESGAQEEEEYEVERILGHHTSDPRTHPSELGSKPVMLYRVKWRGYEEPTWEPISSFEESSMLQAYNKRHGLTEPTLVTDSDEDMSEAG